MTTNVGLSQTVYGAVLGGRRLSATGDGTAADPITPRVISNHSFKQTAALVTTNGAYAADDYVGGLITLTDIARVALGGVLIQSVAVQFKSTQSTALTLLIFDADPDSTTIADNGALVIAAADIFKVKAAIPISQYADLGANGVIAEVTDLNLLVKPAAGRTLYAVLVTDEIITLGSTADVSVDIKGLLID